MRPGQQTWLNKKYEFYKKDFISGRCLDDYIKEMEDKGWEHFTTNDLYSADIFGLGQTCHEVTFRRKKK